MKLVKYEDQFVVECHTDDFGYTSDDQYIFPTKEDLENFLGINNDYENYIYKEGIDIFGRKRSMGSNEYPTNIYSKSEYKIDWENE